MKDLHLFNSLITGAVLNDEDFEFIKNSIKIENNINFLVDKLIGDEYEKNYKISYDNMPEITDYKVSTSSIRASYTLTQESSTWSFYIPLVILQDRALKEAIKELMNKSFITKLFTHEFKLNGNSEPLDYSYELPVEEFVNIPSIAIELDNRKVKKDIATVTFTLDIPLK